ncbi:hypothetical protein [Chengkuizengella marina]|uniref:Uncharacterized protein n=1 Tax=Chengkuizengella marina TaxID=2507566 RepID=A0A6N9Q2R2_9BACL|nr:hypothetical protein [Chengkuizengella marina]NBI28998.1 hypothetical protein [Chengkuizengella marina]
MKKTFIFILIVMLVAITSSNAFAINDNSSNKFKEKDIYKEEKKIEGKNLKLEKVLPEDKKRLKKYFKEKYDKANWESVTKTKVYFVLNEENQLVPLTNEMNEKLNKELNDNQQSSKKSSVQVASCRENCSQKYGLTIYSTAGGWPGTEYPVMKIFGHAFYWDDRPPLDAGLSVDAWAVTWGGNLAIDEYDFFINYDEEHVSNISPATITPNAGIAWEFNEAINKTWPKNNWYAEDGGGTIIAVASREKGEVANSVVHYLHTYEEKVVTSLGLNISATGGGGSIGWQTNTIVQNVSAKDIFNY